MLILSNEEYSIAVERYKKEFANDNQPYVALDELEELIEEFPSGLLTLY